MCSDSKRCDSRSEKEAHKVPRSAILKRFDMLAAHRIQRWAGRDGFGSVRALQGCDSGVGKVRNLEPLNLWRRRRGPTALTLYPRSQRPRG